MIFAFLLIELELVLLAKIYVSNQFFSDLVKTKNMEPNADHESSNEHFFIKEDTKDQRSDDEEDESKDETDN